MLTAFCFSGERFALADEAELEVAELREADEEDGADATGALEVLGAEHLTREKRMMTSPIATMAPKMMNRRLLLLANPDWAGPP